MKVGLAQLGIMAGNGHAMIEEHTQKLRDHLMDFVDLVSTCKKV